jgi:SAM-dependent methyltransferase
MLRQAQALNARAIREGGVELRLGDVTRPLPYEEASFDKLYAVQVLYFLADPLPVLREARRVLGPHGVAAITLRSGEALKSRLAQTGIYTLYADDEIAALFREAGFGETRIERAPFGSGAATCVVGTGGEGQRDGQAV